MVRAWGSWHALPASTMTRAMCWWATTGAELYTAVSAARTPATENPSPQLIEVRTLRWQLIEAITLPKPAEGASCNGCGLCCVAEVCDLGRALGDDRNCKALIQNPDRTFSCGLVADPYSYFPEDDLKTWRMLDQMSGNNAGELALKKMNAEALGAGRGCDSDDDYAAQILAEARVNHQLNLDLPGP